MRTVDERNVARSARRARTADARFSAMKRSALHRTATAPRSPRGVLGRADDRTPPAAKLIFTVITPGLEVAGDSMSDRDIAFSLRGY
jgi:hypothetical protein